MSFEHPPGSVDPKHHSTSGNIPAAKITSSPDTKVILNIFQFHYFYKSIRPSGSDYLKNIEDFQMSAALSSIHRSGSNDFNEGLKKR